MGLRLQPAEPRQPNQPNQAIAFGAFQKVVPGLYNCHYEPLVEENVGAAITNRAPGFGYIDPACPFLEIAHQLPKAMQIRERTEPYRLILADDHQLFLEGLKMTFSNYPQYEVVCASLEGKEVQRMLNRQPRETIDLVICDAYLTGADGQPLCHYFYKHPVNTKVMMISTWEDPELIAKLMVGGISGYVSKKVGHWELTQAVEQIVRGGKYFSQSANEHVSAYRQFKKAYGMANLSTNEVAIVQLIASEYTTSEIAEELHLSKHTVDSYRKNIISKLGVRNTAGITKFALKMNSTRILE